MRCNRGESFLPNSSDEIKRWLDDAVKKIQASSKAADTEKPESSGAAEQQIPASGQPAPDSSVAPQTSEPDISAPDSFAVLPYTSFSQPEFGAPAAVPEFTANGSDSPATPQRSEMSGQNEFATPQKTTASESYIIPPTRRTTAPAPSERSPHQTTSHVPSERTPHQTTAPAPSERTTHQTTAPAPSGRSPHQRPAATRPGSRTAPLKSVPPEPGNRATTQKPVSPEQDNRAAPRESGATGAAVPVPLQKKYLARSRRYDAKRTAAEKGNARTNELPAEDEFLERAINAPKLDTGPDDFKVKFDFESAYIDVPEDKPVRIRREKRTGCVGGILYSAFVICVSLVLASLVWLAAADVLGFGTVDEQVNIMVEKDFTIEDVIESLFDAGLIKYKFLFKIYADYSHAEDKIVAGSYILNKNYDYRAIVYGMTPWEGVLVETTVTIPEGFTLAEIFTRLEDYGVCSAADLWDTATNYNFNYSFLDRSTRGQRHRLEGFLFPETYNFYLDSSPVQVINRFLSEFDSRFTETYVERAEYLGYSIRDIISVASMIEREAGSDEERPRIAAVIYNRLDDSEAYPYLQIDATIRYAIAGTGRTFSTDIDSPYNTYLHEGLPPSPIANPGMESIRAALYPDSTDEYYYALNLQDTHEFFRTLAEHEAFVASDEYGGR